jgi:hypothetical protein
MLSGTIKKEKSSNYGQVHVRVEPMDMAAHCKFQTERCYPRHFKIIEKEKIFTFTKSHFTINRTGWNPNRTVAHPIVADPDRIHRIRPIYLMLTLLVNRCMDPGKLSFGGSTYPASSVAESEPEKPLLNCLPAPELRIITAPAEAPALVP